MTQGDKDKPSRIIQVAVVRNPEPDTSVGQHVSASSALGLQAHTTMPGSFIWGPGDLNSGPYTCVESTLLTKLSLQPLKPTFSLKEPILREGMK